MPSNKEIAGWMKEVEKYFGLQEQGAMTVPAQIIFSQEKIRWHKRSSIVMNMRCETCRWWDKIAFGLCQRSVDDAETSPHSKYCYGPRYSCCHWEG